MSSSLLSGPCYCSDNGAGWPHDRRPTCPVDTTGAIEVSFFTPEQWAIIKTLKYTPLPGRPLGGSS